MNLALVDIVGLVGGVIFVAAFAYANWSANFDRLWFNAANLLGAVLLLISLSVNFNLPAFVLEVAWGIIALLGLLRAIHNRVQSKKP